MTNHEANRLRNLINGMAHQLENETDPAKRSELKCGIRAAEIKLSGTHKMGHFAGGNFGTQS